MNTKNEKRTVPVDFLEEVLKVAASFPSGRTVNPSVDIRPLVTLRPPHPNHWGAAVASAAAVLQWRRVGQVRSSDPSARGRFVTLWRVS